MSPKGNEHEICKQALIMYWARRCPEDLAFIPETTFRLSLDTYLEPDIVVMPASVGVRGWTDRRHCSRGDRRILARLRSRPQGASLRKVRDPGTLGDRSDRPRDPHPARSRAGGIPGGVAPWADERVVPALAPAFELRLNDLRLLP